MNFGAWFIGILGFLAVLSTASAGFSFGVYGSDYYFELYSGNRYVYAATPYTYAYDGYYYFDYPFRAYNYGSYNYYPAGWYGGFTDSYWSFAPDCLGCYSYYPSNYYYYGGAWSYYPGWVDVYAPAYYGAYYYPPSQPTLTGQHYQPRQEASCSEA